MILVPLHMPFAFSNVNIMPPKVEIVRLSQKPGQPHADAVDGGARQTVA